MEVTLKATHDCCSVCSTSGWCCSTGCLEEACLRAHITLRCGRRHNLHICMRQSAYWAFRTRGQVGRQSFPHSSATTISSLERRPDFQLHACQMAQCPDTMTKQHPDLERQPQLQRTQQHATCKAGSCLQHAKLVIPLHPVFAMMQQQQQTGIGTANAVWPASYS